MEELALFDLEGERQRSLTRCSQAWQIFFAFQLQPDPSHLDAQLKSLSSHLNDEISVLINRGPFSGAVGHGSGKVGAVDHYPGYSPILIDRVQELLSRGRHEISLWEYLDLYRFRV